MKLYNNSSEFKIKYNGFEFTVPNGWFEVKTDHLKQFIINKAKIRWGLDILESEPVIAKESIVEPVKEEVKKKEEVKEEVIKKAEDIVVEKKEDMKEEKKAKKSKKVEDLENSL